jgi:hypothetical protein
MKRDILQVKITVSIERLPVGYLPQSLVLEEQLQHSRHNSRNALFAVLAKQVSMMD